jgi:hypothetical protein
MRDMAAREGCGGGTERRKRGSCRCRREDAQHVAVIGPMCNLYFLTAGDHAIPALARAMSDRTGLAEGALRIIARGGREDEGGLTV